MGAQVWTVQHALLRRQQVPMHENREMSIVQIGYDLSGFSH